MRRKLEHTGRESVLRRELASEMKKAPEVSPAHDIKHVERVWRACMVLGRKLDADLEVLSAAAYLHDLGRHYGLEPHGGKSAELAEPILRKIKFPEPRIPAVLDCILKHDVCVPPSARTSVESRILYDADKMDCFGRVGLDRWIKHMRKNNLDLDYVLNDLDERWRGLHFDETRVLAKKDFDYVKKNLLKKI